MNLPASRPVAETGLSRQEKEKLLRSMYSLSHWIAIIRLFRYQTIPLAQARKAIDALVQEFGQEPVASASQELVEIGNPDKEPFARLKPHIRHMAFQILGPEKLPGVPDSIGKTDPPKDDAPCEQEPPRPAAKKKRKKTSVPTATVEKPDVAAADDSSVMAQYRAAKETHPGMLLLFRLGDFYELFGEDAEIAGKLLGLTLTTRDRTLPMAGFPHHQLEAYLQKLLQAGQRVAVCEPVEESLAHGPIRREVTRVVTPGSMIENVEPENDGEPAERQPAGRPMRQPRHFALKEYEARLNEAGLAFVAVGDVQRTMPNVVPHVSGLDFIVLRGDEKFLVTVRPHLQAKHLKAIRELQDLFGPEYQALRVWPLDGWAWQEWPVDTSAAESAQA